jgi:hypothetical protein
LIRLAGAFCIFLALATIRVVSGTPCVTLLLTFFGSALLETDDLIFGQIGGKELRELDCF